MFQDHPYVAIIETADSLASLWKKNCATRILLYNGRLHDTLHWVTAWYFTLEDYTILYIGRIHDTLPWETTWYFTWETTWYFNIRDYMILYFGRLYHTLPWETTWYFTLWPWHMWWHFCHVTLSLCDPFPQQLLWPLFHDKFCDPFSMTNPMTPFIWHILFHFTYNK